MMAEVSENAVLSRRNDCRLCEGLKLEMALSLKPTAIAEQYVKREQVNLKQETYPLDLYLCGDCGHLQMLDVINPEVLYRGYTFKTSGSLGFVQQLNKGADSTMTRMFPTDQTPFVVEIGSNDGSVLKYYQSKGMRVLGVDPAREIARKATDSGLETWPEFFTPDIGRKIRKEREQADIVVANNVYAHADDLNGMTEGIREVLSPTGIFSFEVSYLVDIVQKMLFDTVYHEHLSYHSVKPLESFFGKHGMELVDVERIKAKGGSIRGFAQLQEGPREQAPTVRELLDLEKRMGLDRVETFREYGEKIDDIKRELHRLLKGYKSQGKTIAGYGSSHTVNTLMHHFELDQFIDFIALDTEWKQGLFTPNHHISLVSPEELVKRKIDYTIILAWNYSKPIMEKNQAYRENGGQWIIPLPEAKVVSE